MTRWMDDMRRTDGQMDTYTGNQKALITSLLGHSWDEWMEGWTRPLGFFDGLVLFWVFFFFFTFCMSLTYVGSVYKHYLTSSPSSAYTARHINNLNLTWACRWRPGVFWDIFYITASLRYFCLVSF
ncbi:hypothetical protein GE21DRAFT_1206712 [Neurospora crassa]|nr:hypothetical protein B15I20.70 [imported] - Neurospora crassa [Neurospora crassa]KHE85309.1 hypothetical protein GE21DRAFT_1206712 [Neurospora crassa]